MRKLFYLMAGITLCFSSCDDPFDKPFRAYTEDPVSLYLQADPEFSDWVSVLKRAGYFNALNVTSMQTTHFAVKNAPLKQYARDIFGVDNILDVSVAELKVFVQYHTIPNYKISARNMAGKINRRTATRDYLTAVYDHVGKIRYIENGDKAPSVIIQPDIEVTNGYIHVLDTPLVTQFKNLWEVLSSREDLSIFCDALEATGLNVYLANTSLEFELGPKSVKVNPKDEKTVFAVNNDAFGEYNIYNYEDLAAFINSTVGGAITDPTNVNSSLYQYMVYHIVPKSLSYSDLGLFPLDPVKNDGVSRLKGMSIYAYNPIFGLQRTIAIEDQLAGLAFNPHVADRSNSFTIIHEKRDIPASNGYIHYIDNIMLKPERMAFFPVEYEPTSEIQFRGIDFYQDFIAKGVPAKTFEFSNGDFVNGDVQTMSWTTLSSDTKVWYASIWMDDENRFLNQDAIYFNLGPVGYLDFYIRPLPQTGNDRRYAVFVEKGNDPFIGGKYDVAHNRQNLGGGKDFKTGVKLAKWVEDGGLRLGAEEEGYMRFKVGEFGGVASIDRFIFMPAKRDGTPHPILYYYSENSPI